LTTGALPGWREACKANGLKANLIPRDIKTRWNSTYDMLKFAVKYRVVVDAITGNKQLKLRQYELFDDDWLAIKDLIRVLKVCQPLFIWSLVLTVIQMYKDATTFFSQESVSTIAHVIPTIDRIDTMLSESSTEPLTPAVKHGLSFARRVLNKYYSKTDDSNIYRIAMILHPQIKLKYFQRHKWSQEWIDTAEAILREEFLKYDKASSGQEQDKVRITSWTDNLMLTHDCRLARPLMPMSISLISLWTALRNHTRSTSISHLLSRR
jgi:hypothetical protein